MQAYEKRLESKGHAVLRLVPNDNQQTSDLLNQLIDSGYQTFYLANPVDDLLMKRVRKKKMRKNVRLIILKWLSLKLLKMLKFMLNISMKVLN